MAALEVQNLVCLFNCKYFELHNIEVNFNFIVPKVSTDYIRQTQVLNIDNLRLIIYLWKFNENINKLP